MKKIYLLIVTMTIGIWAAMMPVQAQNLMTNGDLELWDDPTTPTSWDKAESTEQESVTVYEGTYSAKVTAGTTDLQQNVAGITGGETYTISYWYLDNDINARSRIWSYWLTGTVTIPDNELELRPSAYSSDDPNWVQYSVTITAPLAADGFRFEVRTYNTNSGGGVIYYDDFIVEQSGTVITEITDAFAVDASSVDVYYNVDLESVDPDDYYLTGTTYTTFSGATIDGSNPKLVHLTGATPPMTGDITLDDVNDDNYGTSFTFYAGIMPISYTNTTNPGGIMNTTNRATFQGIISANDAFNNVWIADAAGSRNGVMIFDYNFHEVVTVGEEIILTANYSPYQGLSEIVNPELLNSLSTGNAPYGPDLIAGSVIDENLTVDTDPAESWEGQLVTIEDFTVESYDGTNYEYRCSWSDGAEAIYYFHIGDNVAFHFNNLTINVGQTYDEITGVVDWDDGTSHYRINPRGQEDFVGGEPPTQLTISSVNGGINPFVGSSFEVVVQALDQFGNPAVVDSDVNFTLVSNVGTSGVDFTGTSTTTGTISNGLSEVTVSGVQMEPAGTGVILTVNDDATVLTSGTSPSFDVVEFAAPDLIVTEVMQDPLAVNDSDGEYFEVFNTTESDIDMNGYVIADAGSDNFIVSVSLIVPAGGFAVFGNNSDNVTNGNFTVDYDYGTDMFLSNGDDEIIIYLSDGTTEVSRIEWDGGSVWPDPTGAAMVFTGTSDVETNNGLNWTTATLREPSYVGTEGDLGSPGTNGSDQNLTGGLTVDLTVFLEGPYLGGNLMSTTLNTEGYIPLSQPYGPTLPYYDISDANDIVWYYTGSENVASIPAGVVDWVVVQLRDADDPANATSATIIGELAAFLLDDGSVVGLDGSSMLTFGASFTQNLYAVVFHRNHLGVISANGLTETGGVYSYDFSTDAAQAYGGSNGHKDLGSGVWGMIAADGNGNGLIQNTDETAVWKVDLGNSGYMGGDFEMTGLTQNTDETSYWKPNLGGGGQTPAKANLGYECQVPK
ncbi:MAG: lamin tail domain-containing protein [Bacteroidetes bacterium]|nr:lamin tail domain-containing protein [Bacteroidota bacterium]